MSRAEEPLMTLATFLVLTLSLVLAAPSAQAQDMKNFSRIVRLSYVEGHVSFQHSSDVDWTAASVNLALQAGDRIYTGEDGRAEIEFDDGSVLRLAEKSDVEILALKDDFIQFRILLGLSTLTVGSSLGFEMNTPAAAFNTLRKGVYRFDVHENGDSDGIVRKGLMEAANNSFTERLDSGELVHVSPGDQDTHVLSRYTDRDAWDEWTDRRIADAVAYDSKKYLPDYVHPGVRELDRHGRWTVIDEYGPAWVPQSADPGMGSLPGWALVLSSELGMDLGIIRTLGLAPVSLWPLVPQYQLGLVLDPRPFFRVPLLVSRPGAFLSGTDIGLVVSARTWRLL